MLLPTSTHLLLQGTDIVWTVAAAHCINRERIGRVELSACALCFVGSTLLSIRVGATLTAPLLPLCINLASPMLLGLCISTLRVATVELMRVDGPLKVRPARGRTRVPRGWRGRRPCGPGHVRSPACLDLLALSLGQLQLRAGPEARRECRAPPPSSAARLVRAPVRAACAPRRLVRLCPCARPLCSGHHVARRADLF